MALHGKVCEVRVREGPLEDLIRRGLVTPPERARSPRRARVKARGPVSGLVALQRR